MTKKQANYTNPVALMHDGQISIAARSGDGN
jgi:hypothetical protein